MNHPRDENRPRHDGPVPPPPEESGIVVEETSAGTRVTLPHLHTRSDVIVAVVAGAVAAWIGVWLRGMSIGDQVGSTLGMALMGGIGLAFGYIAASELYGIVTRPVIEGRGDELVLSRRLGARFLLPRSIPGSTIETVDRGFEDTGDGGPETVRIWTDDGVQRVGAHLDPEALEWLEDAVRRLAGR